MMTNRNKTSFFHLTSFFVVLMFITQFVYADDNVLITVKGTLAASTCSVVGGSSQTVNLGNVGVALLGASNLWIPFSIRLEHCPIGMSKATITFSGEPDPDNALYFKNTATSSDRSPAAENVAIEMTPQTGDAHLSNGSQMEASVNGTTHKAEFAMKARMIASGGRATAGIVKGHLGYTVEYN